ncbi:MAG: phosphoglycerate dehydrogenase [Thermodesulfobacteriota bacterium]|nr:phosphoglycerate dehydrogenase [Thermodesulfobacteriota bacterium]
MTKKKHTIYIPIIRAPVEPQRSILEPIATILTGEPKSEEEFISTLKKADAVLLTVRNKMNREAIETCPHLKLIAKYGVGVEMIDIAAATEKGIPVINVPTVNSNAVAEFTIGLMISVMRHIQKAKEHIRKGGWQTDRLVGSELIGCTVGIIGYGDVAKGVIRKLQGFEVRKILVFTESKRHTPTDFPNVAFVDLDTLLKESDVVSLHKTLTAKSKGLIGERALRTMRKTSYFINTARGPIVDEKALIKALREGWIAGAALDVHEQEPLPQNSPFLKMENVVLTPHIGGMTYETRRKMVTTSAQNIADFLVGKEVDRRFFVNREVLK